MCGCANWPPILFDYCIQIYLGCCEILSVSSVKLSVV